MKSNAKRSPATRFAVVSTAIALVLTCFASQAYAKTICFESPDGNKFVLKNVNLRKGKFGHVYGRVYRPGGNPDNPDGGPDSGPVSGSSVVDPTARVIAIGLTEHRTYVGGDPSGAWASASTATEFHQIFLGLPFPSSPNNDCHWEPVGGFPPFTTECENLTPIDCKTVPK